MKTCIYCYEWNRSSVIKKLDSQGKVLKRCAEIGKQIESMNESCEKFKPCTSFFCNKNEFFVTFEICKNRFNKCKFGNKGERSLYSTCEKCKQFEHYIKPICDEFKIITPQIAKIKRRDAPKILEIKRRKDIRTIIKRRKRS